MSDTVPLFIEAWKLMTGRFASARFEDSGGVTSCFANVPLVFFNISVANRPADTAEELGAILQTAADRAASCEHPSALLLREDWLPPNWKEPVEAAGLSPMMAMTGMEAGELLPPRRPAPPLEIRRVVDDAGARDLAALNAQAYGFPIEAFECMANMRLWHADSYAYVGYVDGKPVSSAAALPVAGTVYIALVATLPGEQGKGYADTVMRHAVTQGQQAMGTTRTTLHATDMGQPVYRAMGYTSGPRLVLVGPAH